MGSSFEHGQSSARKDAFTLGTIFLVAICMSFYALLMLSKNSTLIVVMILLLSVLELVSLLRMYKESTRSELGIELLYFVVLLSVFVGPFREHFANHRIFMFATILYRPYYTAYANRRIALVLGLLIVAVVLPITIGLVRVENTIDILAVAYAALVVALWVSCSKFATIAFGRS